MKVIYFDQADRYQPERDWQRISLCNEKNISLEYFIKPPNHASPMHEHIHEQVCIVIKGKMKVRNNTGNESILGSGDAVYFAPNEKHSIENMLEEPSTGIDIFVPGRSFDFWKKKKSI